MTSPITTQNAVDKTRVTSEVLRAVLYRTEYLSRLFDPHPSRSWRFWMYQLTETPTWESQIGNLVIALIHVTMTDLHPWTISSRECGGYEMVNIVVVSDLVTIEDYAMVSIAIWSRGEQCIETQAHDSAEVTYGVVRKPLDCCPLLFGQAPSAYLSTDMLLSSS